MSGTILKGTITVIRVQLLVRLDQSATASIFVAPASCRLSRGHLALGGEGGMPLTTAAETAALRSSTPRTLVPVAASKSRGGVMVTRRRGDEQARPDELGNDPGQVGPDSAGQSGDPQQLSSNADADSESVQELADTDQALEAGIVEGVEDAADHPERPVHTPPRLRTPRRYSPASRCRETRRRKERLCRRRECSR